LSRPDVPFFAFGLSTPRWALESRRPGRVPRRVRGVDLAVVEGEFPVVDGSANHVLMVWVGRVEDRRVVDPVAFRPDAACARRCHAFGGSCWARFWTMTVSLAVSVNSVVLGIAMT
jgi:hypothetical protein